MKTSIALVLLVLVAAALAAPMVQNHPTAGGAVTVTNAQPNSVWAPVAVLFAFDAPVTGTISIDRSSLGASFQLASIAVTAARHVTWIADTDFAFQNGDALSVTCPAATGTVQIIRKGIP
jgi:hypothetical protein